MERLFLALALMIAATGAASAQDASQIARVQAGQSCPGCNLFQADLAYRDLPRIDVTGARLRQANLALATMNGARFDRADLSIANLFGARFTGASFRQADLSRAVLVGAHFGSANLSGANLSGAILSGAELNEAHGLTQAQLSGACGDASTRLPAGLTVPACR
ncbi:pentapeptide repeat-containing protein [Maricaulis sp. CAU 1757]